jgi:vacuolar-type H+-ATPase subunit F/Vma7
LPAACGDQQAAGFYGDEDFLLDGNTPLGDEAMDASSQLLIALTTDNEQEAQGWKPDGLLYQDFLVMLRVYLGWRFKAKITLTTLTDCWPSPLGEVPFWLGMNGVLGAEDDSLLTIFLRPLRQNWAITPGWSLRNHNKETDVLRTNLTKTALAATLLAFSLAGCGVTQSVTDGTKSAFNAVFYKKIKVLHLDFTAREALNTDSRENNSLSEPVVVGFTSSKTAKPLIRRFISSCFRMMPAF